jgi:hypothetical protein
VINIGEQVSLNINTKPTCVKDNPSVNYRVSKEGYITIIDHSNDGCILKAENKGTVVLIASAGTITTYLEILVTDVPVVDTSYIVVPMKVIEINENEKKSVQVSLYGGTTQDNATFQWTLEDDKENITIESSANIVVISGAKRGSQRIFINHPKSKYQVEILVLVVKTEKESKYATI